MHLFYVPSVDLVSILLNSHLNKMLQGIQLVLLFLGLEILLVKRKNIDFPRTCFGNFSEADFVFFGAFVKILRRGSKNATGFISGHKQWLKNTRKE